VLGIVYVFDPRVKVASLHKGHALIARSLNELCDNRANL